MITETEQRLVPSNQGITVFTTATLGVERQRKHQGEEMHMNFLLRALGESAKVVKSDSRNLAFLIETLSSLTARYQLAFTDDDTSEMELQELSELRPPIWVWMHRARRSPIPSIAATGAEWRLWTRRIFL